MSLQLTYNSPHLSIKSLSAPPLPNFTVLTGLNGSGKSHLLEAIKNGRVGNSAPRDPNADVAHYTWDSIVPSDVSPVNMAERIAQQREAFWSNWRKIETVRERYLSTLSGILDGYGIQHSDQSLERFLDKDTFLKAIPGDVDEVEREDRFDTFISSVRNQAAALVRQQQLQGDRLISKVLNENPKRIFFSDGSEVYDETEAVLGEINAFQQKLSERFGYYREIYNENVRVRDQYERGNTIRQPLSDQDFIAKYGQPPWEFLNMLLKNANLDFEVDAVDFIPIGPVQPKLRKINGGDEVKFAQLSSGEKVLMSFALFLYNHLDEKQGIKYPKLILLDEVDAPLHPSMVKFLIETIRDIVVGDLGIPVIMTTHSPTTISLADPDSLFVLRARDKQGPEIIKCTQQQALNTISAGVPAMAISFENRRQVFCESKTDAQIWSELYEATKETLAGPYSLSFIPVGKRSPDGQDQNTGCDQVRTLVPKLRQAGAESIFGLIDWDTKNTVNDGIFVHHAYTRYSIENVVLDPVLFIHFFAKNEEDACRKQGFLDKDQGYKSLSEWKASVWQQKVDALAAKVFGSVPTDKVSVKYSNGTILQIDKRWLEKNGHYLEKRLIETYHSLKNSKYKDLSLKVVAEMTRNYKEWLPASVASILDEMSSD